MSDRERPYAVLWDLDETPTVPCGLAIDYGNQGVRVRLPNDGWGLKEWYLEPLPELRPDSTEGAVWPGDSGYFERVLSLLHRSFAITRPGGEHEHARSAGDAVG